MNWPEIGKRLRRFRACKMMKDQRGFTLIEVLVAVAILGVVAVAFLSALSSGYIAVVLSDEKTMANAFTRTEFEKVRNSPFVVTDNYTFTNDTRLGYDVLTVLNHVVPNEGDDVSSSPVQKVTVIISRYGEEVSRTSTYWVQQNLIETEPPPLED